MADKTEKKETKVAVEKKPKLDLTTLAVGAVDSGQTLVAKEGNRQMWKTVKGKFGVVRVENNRFVIILRAGADEATAKEALKTGVAPAKPAPAPKEKKAAAPAAPKAAK